MIVHDHPRILSIVDRLTTDLRRTVTQLRGTMLSDKTVHFVYDGKIRVVEVHAIGSSPKDGSLVMRGYQVAGVASRPLPQWTLFSVAKLDALSVGPEASQAPREGYTQGDKQMAQVISEIAL